MNSMKNVFVTLFDSGYLSRGLVLHESLCRVCKEFKLFIIAFDDKVYVKLSELHLKNTIIISLEDFEDDELLSVKQYRSRGEYCWTSTPKSIQYVFNTYRENICTYIDADMIFFSDPQCLIDEMGADDAVMITEHRYAEYCDQTETSGKYCVQFMPFFNNSKGNDVLEWWKDRCIEKCCRDVDNGYCGDQKYLDDWCDRFDCIHVLNHIGGGIAPWNVNKYTFWKQDNVLKMREKSTGKIQDAIFYHTHNLKFFDKGVVLLTKFYDIPDTAMVYIYKDFFRLHNEICRKYSISADDGWMNQQHFRDDVDHLMNEKNYFLLDMFL